MPIDLRWGNPNQTILHCRFIDIWNGIELQDANIQIWEMLNNVHHKVKLLLDFTEDDALLRNSSVLLLRMLLRTHPNLTHVVLIGSTLPVQFIGRVMRRIFPDQTGSYQCAETLAAAYQLVAPDDETQEARPSETND